MEDEKKLPPILVGEPLTESQLAVISKFTSKPFQRKGKKEFARAFKIGCSIEMNKGKLKTASGSLKPRLKNQIGRLEARITPIKKQKAIDDRKLIVVKCSEYFKQHGTPNNITDFINGLRREGVLTKTNIDKKSQISDTTVRNLLRDIFRIGGQNRRKRVASK